MTVPGPAGKNEKESLPYRPEENLLDSCPGHCCDTFLGNANIIAPRLKYELPITVPGLAQKKPKYHGRDAFLHDATAIATPLKYELPTAIPGSERKRSKISWTRRLPQ